MAYAGLDPTHLRKQRAWLSSVPTISRLQLVLKFKDAYLVRDAIGVVRPSVLGNATPNEIFQ
jgi:hypothetical protein